jgi:hypothetical protein
MWPRRIVRHGESVATANRHVPAILPPIFPILIFLWFIVIYRFLVGSTSLWEIRFPGRRRLQGLSLSATEPFGGSLDWRVCCTTHLIPACSMGRAHAISHKVLQTLWQILWNFKENYFSETPLLSQFNKESNGLSCFSSAWFPRYNNYKNLCHKVWVKFSKSLYLGSQAPSQKIEKKPWKLYIAFFTGPTCPSKEITEGIESLPAILEMPCINSNRESGIFIRLAQWDNKQKISKLHL